MTSINKFFLIFLTLSLSLNIFADEQRNNGLLNFKFDNKLVNQPLVKSLLEPGETLVNWHSCLKNTSIEKNSAVGIALGDKFYSANRIPNCLTILTEEDSKLYLRSIVGVSCKAGTRPGSLSACYSGYQIINQAVKSSELSLTRTNRYIKSETTYYRLALGKKIRSRGEIDRRPIRKKSIKEADSSFLLPIGTFIYESKGPGSYEEITQTIKNSKNEVVYTETYTIQYDSGLESCESMSERLSHNWYMQEKKNINLYFDSVSIGGNLEGTITGEGEAGGVAGPIAIVGIGIELTGGLSSEFTINYRDRVMDNLKDLTTKLRNDVRQICEINNLDQPPSNNPPPSNPTGPETPEPPEEPPQGAFDCGDMQKTIDCVDSSTEYSVSTSDGEEFITRTCRAYKMENTSGADFDLCQCRCFESKKVGTAEIDNRGL